MKLLGMKTRAGKPAGDADTVADLKPGSKIMLIGCVTPRLQRLITPGPPAYAALPRG
jgi:hypothetical protein